MTNQPSEKPDLLLRPYSDEELGLSDEMRGKLERLMKFFDEAGIDYDKFDPNSIPKIDFGTRKAYPNNDAYMYIPGQHDTHKWLQAISDIYRQEKSGQNRIVAIRRVTSGWNIMETHDFLNWVRYYEAGDHMKYKFAQLWYENPDIPNYALHIRKDKQQAETPSVSGNDIDFAKTKATEDADRRDIIEKQRNKIIGRLDSAEKLLRSKDGHIFSGKEFESLLESIYQLKKKIQMVNKISSSTRLYEDLIIRQGNILTRQGFTKAAAVLYSVAQTPGQSGEQAEGTPGGEVPAVPAPPAEPTGAGNPGAPGGLPSMGPGMPQGAPSSAAPESIENESPPPKGIADFLEGLEKSTFSTDDSSEAEDDLEVMDAEDALFVTEAQIAPGTNPAALTPDESITSNTAPAPLDPSPVSAPDAVPDAPVKPPASVEAPTDEEPLEVTEEDLKAPAEEGNTSVSDFDNKMDAVFSGITVADVVAKLEDLAKIFKTREVPRQLGMVDMMLDSLGLASYFPSLSEATNKALESNNYISTRVEDILSKLRGAMATKTVDLKGSDEKENPEVAGIKGNLQEDADKEKARKQMRKDQESAELANKGKETPEIEVEEDLAAPPAAPAAAPKPTPPLA